MIPCLYIPLMQINLALPSVFCSGCVTDVTHGGLKTNVL